MVDDITFVGGGQAQTHSLLPQLINFDEQDMDCRLLACGNLPWSLNLSQKSWQASDRSWSEQNKTIFLPPEFK